MTLTLEFLPEYSQSEWREFADPSLIGSAMSKLKSPEVIEVLSPYAAESGVIPGEDRLSRFRNLIA